MDEEQESAPVEPTAKIPAESTPVLVSAATEENVEEKQKPIVLSGIKGVTAKALEKALGQALTNAKEDPVLLDAEKVQEEQVMAEKEPIAVARGPVNCNLAVILDKFYLANPSNNADLLINTVSKIFEVN